MASASSGVATATRGSYGGGSQPRWARHSASGPRTCTDPTPCSNRAIVTPGVQSAHSVSVNRMPSPSRARSKGRIQIRGGGQQHARPGPIPPHPHPGRQGQRKSHRQRHGRMGLVFSDVNEVGRADLVLALGGPVAEPVPHHDHVEGPRISGPMPPRARLEGCQRRPSNPSVRTGIGKQPELVQQGHGTVVGASGLRPPAACTCDSDAPAGTPPVNPAVNSRHVVPSGRSPAHRRGSCPIGTPHPNHHRTHHHAGCPARGSGYRPSHRSLIGQGVAVGIAFEPTGTGNIHRRHLSNSRWAEGPEPGHSP